MIQVGQVLDKYELLERVGQGGMAIVYRGIDRQLKRVVAIKVLHKHLADYQEARDRFEREAQAVAKLRHENILEIFDYSGPDSPESYIVTEFIHGKTLKNFLADHPLPFPEVAEMIASEVARESPELYFEIQRLNDYGAESLDALAQAVDHLRSAVQHNDQAGFSALMRQGCEYTQGRRQVTQQRA